MPLLGDLVLCAPVVAREAREQRQAAAARTTPTSPSTASCTCSAGTTRTTREADCMEQLEREILADLGIEDPYPER